MPRKTRYNKNVQVCKVLVSLLVSTDPKRNLSLRRLLPSSIIIIMSSSSLGAGGDRVNGPATRRDAGANERKRTNEPSRAARRRPVESPRGRRVGAESRRGKWAPSVMFTDLTQHGSWHQARVRRRDCPFSACTTSRRTYRITLAQL